MKQLKLLDIKSSFRRLRKHAYDCKSVYGFREMKGGREKLWGLDLSRILAGSEPSFRQRLGILAEKLKKRWRFYACCTSCQSIVFTFTTYYSSTPLWLLPNATPAIATFAHHPCCSTAVAPLRGRCRPNRHLPDVLRQPQVYVLCFSSSATVLGFLVAIVTLLRRWYIRVFDGKIDRDGGVQSLKRFIASLFFFVFCLVWIDFLILFYMDDLGFMHVVQAAKAWSSPSLPITPLLFGFSQTPHQQSPPLLTTRAAPPPSLRFVDVVTQTLTVLTSSDNCRPHKAYPVELAQFHSADYVEFLIERVYAGGTIGKVHLKEYITLNSDDMHTLYPCFLSDAARRLNNQLCDIAINWAGGLHHAKKCEASGILLYQ
ncbi:hypothetical protein R6Q59_010452 [Mikania micrantha]